MITVENLTKSFRQHKQTTTALDDVSLAVPAGAICGVVGPTGGGKSTLVRAIALLEKPERGAIRIDGTDLLALDGSALRAARRRIGVVPHGDSLLRQRTAAGNVALPLEASGISAAQRRGQVAELLDLVGLAGKASVYPDQLTDAQRQRVAVARALAGKPALLLADDPTADLDPTTADSVLTVLDRVRSELDATVLVATRDMAVVRRIADDVAVLDAGRLVEHGKVLDLITEPGSRVADELLPAPSVSVTGTYDVVAEVTLVGFAAVGALLPEAASRFDVALSILGGGQTRIGDTPVAKFHIGLTGERAETALKWMIERDAQVRRTPVRVEGVVAA